MNEKSNEVVTLFQDYPHSSPILEDILRGNTDDLLVYFVIDYGYAGRQLLTNILADEKNVVWMKLSPLDNSTVNFWSTFLDTIKRIDKVMHKKLSLFDFPHTLEQQKAVNDILIEYFPKKDRIYVIIENYDCINDPSVSSFLQSQFDLSKGNLSRIVLSNRKKDLGFSRMRPSGIIYYISNNVLMYSPSKIVDVFAYFGLGLEQEEAEHIFDMTDGWPLGTFFYINEIMKNPHLIKNTSEVDLSLFIEFFNAYHRDHINETENRILIMLALQDEFDANLINTVIPEGFNTIMPMLADNMFVTQDKLTNRFTFQKIYRSYLLGQIGLFTNDELNDIYIRYANWHEDNNDFIQSFNFYNEADEYEMSYDALTKINPFNITEKNITVIEEYLNHLPEEFIDAHILVYYYQAIFMIRHADYKEAYKKLKYLMDNLTDSEENAELLGEVYIAYGLLNHYDGIPNYPSMFKLAAERLPWGSRFFEQSNDIFELLVPTFYMDGDENSIVRMEKEYKETLGYISHLCQKELHGANIYLLAEIAYQKHDLKSSEILTYRALHTAKKYMQTDVMAYAYSLLVNIYLLKGKFNDMQEFLDEFSTLIKNDSGSDMKYLYERTKAWVNITIGDMDAASEWIDEVKDNLGTSIINRGRNICKYAEYLLERGKYHEVIGILDRLDEETLKSGLWFEGISVYIMKAIAFTELDECERAFDAFSKAYELSYSSNIITPYIHFGNYSRKLISHVLRNEDATMDKAWLEQVRTKATSYAKVIRKMRKSLMPQNPHDFNVHKTHLTVTEEAILLHLSTGLTIPEIAEIRTVSVNTVKRQVSNIYNKLGSNNRADAIHTATIQGLLD